MRRLARWFYDDPSVDDEDGTRSIAWFLTTFLLVLVVIMIAVALIAASNASFSGAAPNMITFLGVAVLTGATGFAGGGFIGFLFGVPRVQTAEARTNAAIASNTNLEQVSDWLTKIIVGVSLVEFPRINDQLRLFRTNIDEFMQSGPSAGIAGAGFAAGLILVGSAIAGFLTAYLKSKTDLMSAFAPRAKVEGRLGRIIGERIMGTAGQRMLDRPSAEPERCARDTAANFIQLVPSNTSDAKLHRLLGLAHAIQKNFRAAAESFRRAIDLDLDGKVHAALVALAVRAYASAGDLDMAFEIDRKHPSPRDTSVADENERRLALVFASTYARGRHDEAIELGEALARTEVGNSGRLWLYLAVAHAQRHASLRSLEPAESGKHVQARDDALAAARRAVQLDQEANRPVLRLLWDPDYPGKPAGKNSLESLYPDEDFERLLYPQKNDQRGEQGRNDNAVV
jgi:tetratricopeptide (TPR) repeat protein